MQLSYRPPENMPHTAPMTHLAQQRWGDYIEHNRVALLGVLATLFALVDLKAAPAFVTRALKSRILCQLRPAESAARRLIFAFMKHSHVEASVASVHATIKPIRPLRYSALRRLRLARANKVLSRPAEPTKAAPLFALFDRPKRFEIIDGRRAHASNHVPAISFLDSAAPRIAQLPEPENENAVVSADQMGKRLTALKAALKDLPHQAERMAKAIARRAAAQKKSGAAMMISPCRPGFAPGHRKRKLFPVDTLLHECDWLAREARAGPL